MWRIVISAIVALVLLATALVIASHAAPRYDDISIMRPEPGAKRVKRKSVKPKPVREQAAEGKPDKKPLKRRHTTIYPAPPSPVIRPDEGIVAIPPQPSVGQRATDPPGLVVLPGAARAYPNFQTTGRETSQDRAFRCTQQAGSYGVPGEQRNAYVGTCVNQ